MATPALTTIFPDRVLRRPAALEATRICGFTDSEIARLAGVVPMVVSEWVSGKRPIPKVRHQALVLFVSALARIYHGGMHDKGPVPETAHALRADLLFQALHPLLQLAIAECGEPTEETDEQLEALQDAGWNLNHLEALAWHTEEAEALAHQMLERLRSLVVKP